MAYNDIDVPVYLVTGFLESGKTTFLDGTIHQNYFNIPETTLLILCEEGEIEYDEAELRRRRRTVIEVIEEAEDFTEDTLRYLAKKHRPERVLLEFNPLWSVSKLLQMELPEGWGIIQQIVTVDASCFEIYMKNLKSLFVEMVRDAELVLFNRCNKEQPLASFRRSVKVVNPAAEIIFENEDGEVEDIFEDCMPFDLDADVIDILEEDYGIWYVDMMDNPEDYEGKTVRYKGMVLKSEDLDADYFVAGRMAMTCCADDTSFIGYVCKYQEAPSLEMGSWVLVTASIHREYMQVYHDEGPVLYAKEIRPAEKPKEELVYFN
ncbi:GTPase [Ruminococcus sp. OA3]|uniref:TIGR03943 family putative permease subunit n=1 Tax=Ruminococcus sp. OA3 TaxID=2914164 RepID=UPI001F064D8F|nr:GTP-binding protein [Ruminococcus sp. OA3]MCH1981653.1 GTPase [Ruminococcus sp. OA3]